MAHSTINESSPMPPLSYRKAFLEHLEKSKRSNWEGKEFYKPGDIITWLDANTLDESYSNVVGLVAAVYKGEGFLPRMRELQSPSYLLVFATLLHPDVNCGHLIHVFQQCNLSDSRLDLQDLSSFYDSILKDMKAERPQPPLPGAYAEQDYTAVIRAFDKTRWAFCPATLDLYMGTSFPCASYVLPFLQGDVVNRKGGTANVHHYKIQVDLVESEGLKRALESSGHKDPKFGWCYDFAVKSYIAGWEDTYKSESEAFKGLQDHKGVVKYLGQYHFREAGEEAPQHHIILEFGQQDLDEYLAETYPPVLNAEIIAFWEDLFEVADTLRRLHQLKHKGEDGKVRPFKGWHGDIKPDNILRVRGDFKLADFGFTKFEKDVIGKTSTFMEGGTRAYGAPECDNRRMGTATPHLQTIDTWSFGCVLSAVATWVILGSQAYDNYSKVRKFQIAELRARVENGEKISVPSADDAFHDGTEVLASVKNWHNFLRNSARRADTISYRVLDLVEKYMLLQAPGSRLTLEQLCKQLKEILLLAKSEHAESLDKGKLKKVDPDTLKALLELDKWAPETAAPGTAQIATMSHRGPSTLSASAQVLSQLRAPSERVRKSERLEKVVLGKTANREEAIESDLGLRTTDIYESPKQYPVDGDHYILRQAQPTKKNTQGAKTRMILGKGEDTDIPDISLTTDDNSNTSRVRDLATLAHDATSNLQFQQAKRSGPFVDAHSSFYHDGEVSFAASKALQRSSFQTTGKNAATPSLGMEYVGNVSNESANGFHTPLTPPGAPQHSMPRRPLSREGVALVYGREEDGSSGRAGPPSPEMSPKIVEQSALARVQTLEIGFDLALSPNLFHTSAIYTEQVRLEKLWGDKKDSFFAFRNKIPVDLYLKNFISNRDVVFIVDNAASMVEQWAVATEVLATLAMKIGPLDEDGLDLMYTIGEDNKVRDVEGWAIPTKFRSSMQRACHGIDGRFKTNMTETLQKVFDKYWRNISKRMTLIILTDGLWEGCAQENDVQNLIAGFITKLKARLNKTEKRWFSIQFVYFGENKNAIQRLQDLDDNMPIKDDVIDAKPWSFPEVDKLIIGSMTDDGDKNTPSSSATLLPSPGSSRPSISSNGSLRPVFQADQPKKRRLPWLH